ncbi:TetR/AcrR family transcriptional regulator [Cellulomonas hominis]
MVARGSYPKGDAKREEILDVALEHFARQGYDRTSMREIARMTGLSQAGLLHHFASKEALFVEVLRRRDARNEERYDVNRGNPVTIDGLVSIVRHNAQEPGLVRLYVTMSAESTDTEGPARDFFVQRYHGLRAQMSANVARMQAAGELAADLDPDAVAALLIAAADGLQLQWLLDPGGPDMGTRLEKMWAALRRIR